MLMSCTITSGASSSLRRQTSSLIRSQTICTALSAGHLAAPRRSLLSKTAAAPYS